ncbi:MAG: hypothetical protein ACF8XB_13395 [Planctomycetota bacterium JB042]
MDPRPEAAAARPGLAGALKGIAAIAILLVTGLAILLVLGVLPAEMFASLSVKIGMVCGVLAASSTALALLARSR